MKLKVVDQLKGINRIWRLHKSKDIEIYYVNLNQPLKRQEPVQCYDRTIELVWLDPDHKGTAKPKITSINFGRRLRNFEVIVQVTKYSCFIAFYRTKNFDKILTKGKPIFQEKR